MSCRRFIFPCSKSWSNFAMTLSIACPPIRNSAGIRSGFPRCVIIQSAKAAWGANIVTAGTPLFAERELWNIDGGSASLRLDVEGPDDVAPLLRFVGNELAKVGGREREHVGAQVGKPRLDLGISKVSVDLLVELVDNLSGRVFRRTDPIPLTRLVTRHEFGQGR